MHSTSQFDKTSPGKCVSVRTCAHVYTFIYTCIHTRIKICATHTSIVYLSIFIYIYILYNIHLSYASISPSIECFNGFPIFPPRQLHGLLALLPHGCGWPQGGLPWRASAAKTLEGPSLKGYGCVETCGMPWDTHKIAV